MEEFDTNERLLKADVTKEECLKIEKILRKHNISYFEKWKFKRGIFHVFKSPKHGKCDIYIHADSLATAREILGVPARTNA